MRSGGRRDRAELQAFEQLLVVAELAIAEDFDFDLAAGLFLDRIREHLEPVLEQMLRGGGMAELQRDFLCGRLSH